LKDGKRKGKHFHISHLREKKNFLKEFFSRKLSKVFVFEKKLEFG